MEVVANPVIVRNAPSQVITDPVELAPWVIALHQAADPFQNPGSIMNRHANALDAAVIVGVVRPDDQLAQLRVIYCRPPPLQDLEQS